MRCTAKTNSGNRCKNKAVHGELCAIHSPETSAGTGKHTLGMTEEQLYQGILEYHTYAGKNLSQTARLIGVNRKVLTNHMDKYHKWLKKEAGILKDPKQIVNRALARSEDRRSSAYLEQAKDGLSTIDRARLIREMREEESFQVKLLQDVGTLEKTFEGVQVVNQITADHFQEAFSQSKEGE